MLPSSHRAAGEKPIKFRAHHFLCTLCFEGKGYSPAFVKNYFAVIETLAAATIEVVTESDAICAPCPHNQGQSCNDEEKIQALDLRHAEALGLKAGDHITWDAAKQRIAERITVDIFQRICAGCEWQPLGICEGHVSRLQTR